MFERKNYALQVALKKYHEENHTLPERVWCITYKLLLLFVVSYSTRIETGGGGGGGLYYCSSSSFFLSSTSGELS